MQQNVILNSPNKVTMQIISHKIQHQQCRVKQQKMNRKWGINQSRNFNENASNETMLQTQ